MQNRSSDTTADRLERRPVRPLPADATSSQKRVDRLNHHLAQAFALAQQIEADEALSGPTRRSVNDLKGRIGLALAWASLTAAKVRGASTR